MSDVLCGKVFTPGMSPAIEAGAVQLLHIASMRKPQSWVAGCVHILPWERVSSFPFSVWEATMRPMPIWIFSLFILLAGFGLNACDRSDRVEAGRETDALNDRPSMLSAEDKDFVEYESEMHVGEIDLAKQAKQKSTNKDVTEYADAVIRGHSDALDQLSDRIKERGAVSSTASLDTKYHSQFLSPLSGAEFDRQFIELMIADHQDAGNSFREHLKTVQNTDLKDRIVDTLPNLEDLLQEARDVQKKLTAPGSRTN
jgi:putative membrane protein